MNEKAGPSPTAKLKPVPQGVYVMLPKNELPENYPLLGNAAFGGFRLFCNWRDLQPAPDVIELDLIRAAAERVTPHGQKLLVSINFGKGAGEWVYNDPYPCTRFPFTMKGQPAVMPLGFEESYRRKVDDFLKELARAFDKEKAIAGFVMTGAGTLGIEYHVVDQPQDIDAWEAAARAADYPDKHRAIRDCAIYRMDKWEEYFAYTHLLFCLGNPWSNQSGKADEEDAADYATSVDNGGICTESLRAVTTYSEEQGQVLGYAYTEEPVRASSNPDFYLDKEQPFDPAPEPVHAILMTGFNKGATMVELWEEDALNEANHPTIAADAEKLISNVNE